MSVVFWKELADHFSSLRFIILLVLIILIGFLAIFTSGQAIRGVADEVPTRFVFLLLLTSQTIFFSLANFLVYFGPWVGIILGFDAISGEYANGTLSRVLSQPIYRDSLINGKFLAGITTVAIFWFAILLIVIGLGITLLGFPPNGEELWRMLIFTVLGILYVGFWLALALLFSLLFQRTVTAALASFAVWLFLVFFIGMIAQSIASIFASTNITIDTIISRLSPSTLFANAIRIIIDPGSEILERASRGRAEGILPTPLDLGQSLLQIWPHLTTLIAMVVICFGIAYIKFMRDEIRA